MKNNLFVRRIRIEAPADDVFRWHARPGAFERLLPPCEHVEILRRSNGIMNGAETEIRMAIGPFRHRWLAVHSGYVEGRQFRDVQAHGPFAKWEHLHCIEPDGLNACHLEDRIEYALPGGGLGGIFGDGFVRRKLNRLFDYRHAVTRDDVLAHARFADRPPLKILISGSSGLVGQAVIPFLRTGGHAVIPLVRARQAAPAAAIFWNPAQNQIDADKLDGFDAVVHLAGENIAGIPWTPENKKRFYDSRVQSTRLLCESLAKSPRPPKVIVCASATGYYGGRGAELVDENSDAGTGFLAQLTRDWEAAAEPARQRGIRVVHLRFGIVLSPAGGALAKMLTPFRFGLGGILGDGEQYWSWIGIDDAIGAIHYALMDHSLQDPVNAVAPQATTNREFTRTLGHVLHRPAILPFPAFAARMIFGEMADETMLASCRVAPARLSAGGYLFRHPQLESALRHLLGQTLRVN